MAFFNSAVGVLQTLVIAFGADLGILGAISLLESYCNNNLGANLPDIYTINCCPSDFKYFTVAE